MLHIEKKATIVLLVYRVWDYQQEAINHVGQIMCCVLDSHRTNNMGGPVVGDLSRSIETILPSSPRGLW